MQLNSFWLQLSCKWSQGQACSALLYQTWLNPAGSKGRMSPFPARDAEPALQLHSSSPVLKYMALYTLPLHTDWMCWPCKVIIWAGVVKLCSSWGSEDDAATGDNVRIYILESVKEQGNHTISKVSVAQSLQLVESIQEPEHNSDMAPGHRSTVGCQDVRDKWITIATTFLDSILL